MLRKRFDGAAGGAAAAEWREGLWSEVARPLATYATLSPCATSSHLLCTPSLHTFSSHLLSTGGAAAGLRRAVRQPGGRCDLLLSLCAPRRRRTTHDARAGGGDGCGSGGGGCAGGVVLNHAADVTTTTSSYIATTKGPGA